MLDDLASGIRQIRRAPAFACAVVLTLSLAVGATTAVFTLADPMLFRPLPYPQPERLVQVWSPSGGVPGNGLHLADFLAARERHSGFEALTMPYGPALVHVPGRDDDVLGYFVDRDFMDALRVNPVVGRSFLTSEHRTGPQLPDVALITWRLWQTAYGGRAGVVGEALSLAAPERPVVRVVGVLPRDFVYPDRINEAPDVLLPGEWDATNAGSPFIIATPFGRLRPGVSIENAVGEMRVITASIERQYPAFTTGREVRMTTLRQALFGSVRTPILMLLAATGCLLLLACANLAHLFLARFYARRGEFGVRLALGSSESRLRRQLLAESVWLALAGGVVALVAAQSIFTVIMAYTPQFAHVYRLLPAGIDLRVAAFAAALMATALLICTLVPAAVVSRMNVRTQLVTGSGSTVAPGTRLLQRSLIAAQTATAVSLLVTCALIVGSFVRLAYQETGWNPQDLYRVVVAMPEGTARERAAEVRRELYDRLARQSGVRVALADGIPAMTLVGGAVRPGGDPAKSKVSAIAYRATAEIFDVLGVQFVDGRPFDEREARMGLPAAVVDGRAAARLWPGEDPLGRQIMHSNGTIATVVGVVTPLRARLTSDDSDGVVFMTLGPTPAPGLEILGTARLHPRTADIESMARDVAPGASARVAPVQLFERELGEPRFLAVLLLSLGLLTSLLAAVGVFGVVSHQAARRTREMGIRIALGARSPQILWLVLRDALLPAAAGLAIGVGASLWWTETLRAVIHGLEPRDPVAFAVAGALVLALVAAVSMVPARSAARTDPIRALRVE